MSEKSGPLSKVKKLLENNQDSNQKLTKKHYFIIALVLGIAFMLFGNFFNQSNETRDPMPVSTNNDEDSNVETFARSNGTQPSSMTEYEEYYERQLKEALEEIVGVEDVSIVVNVESGEKKVYERNVTTHKQTTNETDTNGGKRTVEDQSEEEQMVLIREGDKEVPLVSETKKPSITGVLIVAKGADNIQIKKWIIEAVTRVLDVPSHRVSVLAKK